MAKQLMSLVASPAKLKCEWLHNKMVSGFMMRKQDLISLEGRVRDTMVVRGQKWSPGIVLRIDSEGQYIAVLFYLAIPPVP